MQRRNFNTTLLERALHLWNERTLSSDAGTDLGSIVDLFQKAVGKPGFRQTPVATESELEKLVDQLLDFPSHRLAVYGSLAPGAENHWVLSELHGVWNKGTVRGHHDAAGWGQTLGFPALVWDPDGEQIAVDLFHSPELPNHWDRIDEFEGDDYQRIFIPVEQGTQVMVANIYALADQR